jgi:Tol biopolymer transport system component
MLGSIRGWRSWTVAFGLIAAGLLPAAGAAGVKPATDGVIVYLNLSALQLFTMLPTGLGAKQLTSTGNAPNGAAFSADGKEIAFTTVGVNGGAAQLWVVNTDGTNAHALPLAQSFSQLLDPTWSPDGRRIAFTATSAGPSPTLVLYAVNADGTSLQEITTTFGGHPAWSPDGKWIAFSALGTNTDTAGHQVSVISAVHPDGSGLHQVTPASGTGDDQEPVWSPDGKWIVFEHLGPDWMKHANYEQPLYEMHPDGSADNVFVGGSGVDFTGTFSPDGSRFVFERKATPTAQLGTIDIVDSKGGHLKRIGVGAVARWGA